MERRPLRRQLEDAVADRRRREALDSPPGVFSGWQSEGRIFFATIGRRTGMRHEKDWGPFAPWGNTLYLAEEIGPRADWVRNVMADPVVDIWLTRSGPVTRARGRLVSATDELARARRLLHRRLSYGNWPMALVDEATIVAFDAESGPADP